MIDPFKFFLVIHDFLDSFLAFLIFLFLEQFLLLSEEHQYLVHWLDLRTWLCGLLSHLEDLFHREITQNICIYVDIFNAL